MSIFSNLFGKKNIEGISNTTNVPEAEELRALRALLDSLLSCTHYAAKSEYLNELPLYRKTVEYFSVLKSSGIVMNPKTFFCDKIDQSLKDAGVFKKFDMKAKGIGGPAGNSNEKTEEKLEKTILSFK